METIARKHPKAFYTIFMLEVWERFGYMALTGILAVYLTRKLNMPTDQAFILYGAFAALVYAFIVLGGYLGDKILGAKRTIILGLITLLAGYILMTLNSVNTVYYAMSLICIGTGLFKSNPSSLLAKCYPQDDGNRLHNAFTLFYMAINIGSMLGLFIVPTLAHNFGYSAAFSAAVIATFLSLLTFVGFGFTMKNVHTEAGAKPLNIKALVLTIISVIVLVFIVERLLNNIALAKSIVVLTFTVTLLAYLWLMFSIKKEGFFFKMLLALILMTEAIAYKISYMQMQTSINFYAINNTVHSIFGIPIAPETFQALNPIWVVIMSPILAYYYTKSNNTKYSLSIYHKFTLGMLLLSLSFITLYCSKFFANDAGIISSNWLILSYFLQSTGELLISALGLAMVAQLVPLRFTGFVIGLWWVFMAFASLLGGYVASLTSPKSATVTNTLTQLDNYTHVFLWIGICILIFTCFMFSLSPLKKRLLG
ncbi:oligopeptide:H+ symporter [Cysteiniphilum sp. QT6929]|uniref:oligopeptide:H+ symporter n=1 Tax=Cysteiniphilum sp. QT6929 TaxID=2975055 RepID=UPI0024B3524C|nr:oligopeptide:H+ symporter [Cysteiniphilum sp. QT6929]WHN64915.1 oligopeptide:H+ symporter [Cysteiniphilum sp. QT6929]